jgi:hypothetical protein
MRWAVVGIALFVASCAGNTPEGNIYPCCIGQSVSGNSAYVTVINVYNEVEALPFAEKHCAKHGKVARFNKMQGIRAIFDCVR